MRGSVLALKMVHEMSTTASAIIRNATANSTVHPAMIQLWDHSVPIEMPSAERICRATIQAFIAGSRPSAGGLLFSSSL
jgi:hypothetical protein